MSLTTLHVTTDKSKYPIYIGEDLFNHTDIWRKLLKNNQVLIVSDENVAKLYLKQVSEIYSTFQCSHIILPAGEQTKSWAYLAEIIDKLVDLAYQRDCTIVALGGGVIGDLAGFAAACYQRGVQFFQVPTTLLAQVDASIGGKTAINHQCGKNLIGAFHQPAAVFCDLKSLQTLAQREFVAGFAEVVKHAVIADAEFFDWLEISLPNILNRDPSVLRIMVERACSIKLRVVEADPKDTNGLRACLNFGHTFAHAIEAIDGYQHWLHGEAVSVGMIKATKISLNLGLIDEKIYIRLKNLLTSAGLPIKFPKNHQECELIKKMFLDKKNQQFGLTLIILKALGCAMLYPDVSSDKLRNLITEEGPLGVS